MSSDETSRESEFLRGLSGAYRGLHICTLSIVGNRADADDVIQEVCVILWQRFDEFEPGTNFQKWACAVGFKVAKAYARKQRRRRGYGLSDEILGRLAQIQSRGSELFELRREILQECLGKMRSQDREFLMGCYGARDKFVNLAHKKQMPVTTVYTRLGRLRKQLVSCVNRALGKEPSS